MENLRELLAGQGLPAEVIEAAIKAAERKAADMAAESLDPAMQAWIKAARQLPEWQKLCEAMARSRKATDGKASQGFTLVYTAHDKGFAHRFNRAAKSTNAESQAPKLATTAPDRVAHASNA